MFSLAPVCKDLKKDCFKKLSDIVLRYMLGFIINFFKKIKYECLKSMLNFNEYL